MGNRVNISHERTDDLVCPYCGYVYGDSWEVGNDNEDLGLMECEECSMAYYATRNITIDYSTDKARYGVCEKCGNHDVIIEDYSSSVGSFKNFCISCGERERNELIREQFN